MKINEIINLLNLSNSSNYKLENLKRFKNDETLKEVLKLTYDKVTYSFGIRKIPSYTSPLKNQNVLTLFDGLKFLKDELATRNLTGNSAITALSELLSKLSKEDAEVIEKIIGRDLKINLGKSQINKVFPNLIVKPPYMRCSVFSEKTKNKINFPAYLQLKADGTFQYFIVEDSKVTFISRSGEERDFPNLRKVFENFENGVYVGELLVRGYQDRQKANGLINSDNPPHDIIYTQLWDYIPLEEYSDSKHSKSFERLPYFKRFGKLKDIVGSDFGNVQVIQTEIVYSIQEALEITSRFMLDGFEGAILKDSKNIFKDHTSNTQLKLKLEIELDMRCKGFSEGTKGTKREETFGAIIFENDEGTIKGQCSGFTDEQLEDFNNRREELIGKVFTVQCNDLTKAEDNDFYALSHPRFIEFRNDKDSTDTIQRCMELKNLAMFLEV